MILHGIEINASAGEIVSLLKEQLAENGINYFGATRDTPDNFMCSCPYHKDGQERRPSAGIKKSDGTFHCFACEETHSLPEVISFCLGRHDDTLGKAGWDWLMRNFVIGAVGQSRPDIPIDIGRTAERKEINYVPESILDTYRYYHDYMWKRKLTPEVVELFDVGYDAETECLTFPVRDITGGTLFVARRSVKTKFFNYPAGVEKPLYGLYELSRVQPYPQTVYICESMLDALAVWVYGGYAVALNGLGNDLQFRQLNSMPCREFILATDMDERGMKARERLKRNIHGKIIKAAILPEGAKDMNDLTKEQFDAVKKIFY